MRGQRTLTSPFGERRRTARRKATLVSRGLVVDPGPQQRASQARRKLERLSRAVVDGLQEGVVVLDGDLQPIQWNASALDMLGIEATELAAAAPSFPARTALARRQNVRVVQQRPAPDGRERSIHVTAPAARRARRRSSARSRT